MSMLPVRNQENVPVFVGNSLPSVADGVAWVNKYNYY